MKKFIILNKFESTLTEDDFNIICVFSDLMVLRRKYVRIFSMYSYSKLDQPIVAHPIPGDPNLNKLESTLPEIASTVI